MKKQRKQLRSSADVGLVIFALANLGFGMVVVPVVVVVAGATAGLAAAAARQRAPRPGATVILKQRNKDGASSYELHTFF